MHYSNRQLEVELQKLAEDAKAGHRAPVELPASLPAEAFQPLPEVIEFVRSFREYEQRTAHLNVGTY